MAKKFQISDDAGVSYFTYPGDVADLMNNATDIKDTVFGQEFESGQTGMISWTTSANGFYKGFAGYVAKVMKSGTPTTLTAEATTLVSGKTYQITAASKRILDRLTAVTVLDNAVDHTADVESIDFLFGKVTFKSTYTVTGPVTITGKYLPTTQIAKAQGFTLNQTAAVLNTTDFITAQATAGVTAHDYGLKTVSLDLNGFYALSNGWLAALQARSEVVIEINPDGGGLSVARGIFKTLTQGQAGKVGELETETIKFVLAVPDPSSGLATNQLLLYPFKWQHASGSTLSTALKKSITAWEDKVLPLFRYLWDGSQGYVGSGVISDISLTGGLDVMNTFAVKVQGSNALVAYP